MSSTSSPTVSRRWLALEMRRLRKQRRLSQAAVAKALGCQVPKISLLENGQRPLQDADLETLLQLFKVPDDDRKQYLEGLEVAHEKGWWELYDDATVPEWLAQFIGYEQGAERIRAYQPVVIHGLLQTPEYAAGVFTDARSELSEEKIARVVEVRLHRQRRFRTGTGAPRLSVVFDEAALRRVVRDAKTMAAQLDHLVDLCEEHANITVRVVPFERGGVYEAAGGPFTILSFPFATDPGLVYRERRSSAEFLDDIVEIDEHSVTFQGLRDLALSPEESLQMLRDTAKSYAAERPLA
jgi:transcriptional regulator with XRE-family HTH domain